MPAMGPCVSKGVMVLVMLLKKIELLIYREGVACVVFVSFTTGCQ